MVARATVFGELGIVCAFGVFTIYVIFSSRCGSTIIAYNVVVGTDKIHLMIRENNLSSFVTLSLKQ